LKNSGHVIPSFSHHVSDRSTMHSADQLVMCVLTPPGRGAVATVALAGADAAAAVGWFFRASSGRSAGELVVGRTYHGRWATELGEEIVVCRTATDEFEIHCHGGPTAIKSIAENLSAAGAMEVGWRNWTTRQTDGAIEHEAFVALTAARTERAANILLDQWQGALRQELRGILADCGRSDVERAHDRLRELADRESLGRRLTRPSQVVLAGLPNVGKSSLINALVGYERTIVFDEPGTTRDVVTAEIAVDGLPIVLSDTAGLRASNDPLEEAGMGLARERLASSDVVILVFDASTPQSIDERPLRDQWLTAIVVKNKCDLLTREPVGDVPGEIRTGAMTGQGIGELLQAISHRLVAHWPPAGAAVPFTEEQALVIRQALAALGRGDSTLASDSLTSLLSAPSGSL
jgi:tRNA modification GTPase